MMTDDLAIIKKQYGEEMMHLCRSMFSTILENPGLLSKLLLEHFDSSRLLYEDIIENHLEVEFKNYIYSFINVENENKEKNVKSPKEMLQEVGYTLYECHTEEEIQLFKKYYYPGEELCTFWGNRLNRCFVFFAVKNNALELERESFINPTRQDEYGTSVISIQFTRDDSHILSIKNRYNHTVNNPDATFSNNLNNIIPGLTESFEKHYNLKQKNGSNSFEMLDYVLANDGKYYKYNQEINNIYYCPNNIIIDNFKVKKYPKEQYVILDYFIIDLKNKSIKLYDNTLYDSFIDSFSEISKIQIENIYTGKKIIVKPINGEDIIIEIDSSNQIVSLINSNVISIGNHFLDANTELRRLDLLNLQTVGNYFLSDNVELRELNLPNLQKVGDDFLLSNRELRIVNLPNLQITGSYFLYWNRELREINFPKLQQIGSYFLNYNQKLREISFPNLEIVGDNFLSHNTELREINFPNLEIVGNYFLEGNTELKKLNLPNLQIVRNYFLCNNTKLSESNLPNLEMIGSAFLNHNEELRELNLPNLKIKYISFLSENLRMILSEQDKKTK